MLYSEDDDLIVNTPSDSNLINGTHHVGERAIVFRFAHYLQNELNMYSEYKSYNLDCEYNRNGISAKILPNFPNGVYPDLIIHKRGRNDKNILVMEFKTYWNSNIDADKKRF